MNSKLTKTHLVLLAAVLFASCSGGGGSASPDYSGSVDTPFTIHDKKDLIGGPNAEGQVGDILLKNDRIRVIIQRPRKNPGVYSFGGVIIDADVVRSDGGNGNDNFGSLFPLINVEWTVNYTNLEVISDGSDGGPKVLRARGTIDVYDYLDLDFIAEVAEGLVGQRLTFSNRFDDRRDPFNIYSDLKGLNKEVITDYTLEPGSNAVRIDTTFKNDGEEDAKMPVGYIVNGTGEISMLIPGIGFTPDLMTQVGGNTPALVYPAFDTSDVSYGFFYKAAQFTDEKKGELYPTTSVSYSGVTGVMMGEEFLKILPIGQGQAPEIHFTIPKGGSKTVTSYFVVGGKSAGNVFDYGLSLIGAATRQLTGKVVDANKKPVENATVAVMSKGATLITYKTDSSGRFQGNLPTGGDAESRRFGNGRYNVIVEMPGYHQNTTTEAGTCLPNEINLYTQTTASVECTLGDTGTVTMPSPVINEQTGKSIPVRLTIVGEDPSPNKSGSAGRFGTTLDWNGTYGVLDVKYITAKGTFDLTDKNTFNLEPGTYRFVVSHGPEYTVDDRLVEVVAGGNVDLTDMKIARAVETPGYISADLHVHSISSPDSALSQEMRVLSAAGEGLDVLQSTDHDFITDYAPIAENLESQGLITKGGMQTSACDEVTPNHVGHINVFPLISKPDEISNGAVDWSNSNREEISPSPDYDWTLDELIEKVKEAPGEKVVQLNHIMDNPSGTPLACGWVTTPFYLKDFGVTPLSSYADPVERRMPARTDGGVDFPIPLGASGLVTTNFDAIELSIGPQLHDSNVLFRSALPSWFNFLNLGIFATATADSDSHTIVPDPIGMPRNFIASSVDPRDKKGKDHGSISLEEYAVSIREHRVTVSAGPIVIMSAKSADGSAAEIGGTVTGKKVTFTVDVKAASWAWFDTIEIYANTEPVPTDDKTDVPMQGTAADPSQFYKPYHLPRYIYSPAKIFKLSEGTIKNWKEENGAISASITFEMNVTEDTWVVAMARGTRSTKGYKSLFPLVTTTLIDASSKPESFDPQNVAAHHADKLVGAPAWGFTNPIFIDSDGAGFVAKYVSEGISPIK